MDQSRNMPFVIAMSVILIPVGLALYYYIGSAQAGFTGWLSGLIISVAVEHYYKEENNSHFCLKMIVPILLHVAILLVFPWNSKWRLIFIPGPFIIVDGIFVFWVMRGNQRD